MARFPWTPVSDEEYIAEVRRWVSLWGRLRLWLLVLNFMLLAGVVWLATQGLLMLSGLVPGNAALPLLGFASGAGIGLLIGWIFHAVIHGSYLGWAGCAPSVSCSTITIPWLKCRKKRP